MLLEHWIIIFKNYRMYTYTFCIFISRHISIFKEFEHYYSIRNKGKCDCKINIILLTSFRLYTVSFMYNATSDIYSILYDEFYSYRINLTLILYEWCIVRDSCAPSGTIIYDGHIFKLWSSAIPNSYQPEMKVFFFKLRICTGFFNLMTTTKSKAWIKTNSAQYKYKQHQLA